jgi:hypothetical protein
MTPNWRIKAESKGALAAEFRDGKTLIPRVDIKG